MPDHVPGPLSCPNGCEYDLEYHHMCGWYCRRCPSDHDGFTVTEIASSAFLRGQEAAWKAGALAALDSELGSGITMSVPALDALLASNPHRKEKVTSG